MTWFDITLVAVGLLFWMLAISLVETIVHKIRGGK